MNDGLTIWLSGAPVVLSTVDTTMTLWHEGVPVVMAGGSSVPVSVTLTGQDLTLYQGDLTVTGAASVTLTGQDLSLGNGTLTAVGGISVTLTGQDLVLDQGTLTVTGKASVTLTGQDILLNNGSLTVTIGSGGGVGWKQRRVSAKYQSDHSIGTGYHRVSSRQPRTHHVDF